MAEQPTTAPQKHLVLQKIYVKGLSDDHAAILQLIGATRVIH